jgi:hypothetical protein
MPWMIIVLSPAAARRRFGLRAAEAPGRVGDREAEEVDRDGGGICSTKTIRKISTIAAMMEARSRYRRPGYGAPCLRRLSLGVGLDRRRVKAEVAPLRLRPGCVAVRSRRRRSAASPLR